MSITRRNLLKAFATGLPVAFLARGTKAFSDGSMVDNPKKQFFILQTSGNGDPINANVPGTYEDPKIFHTADPTMAVTAMTVGQTKTKAALPWAQLSAGVLARTNFWHIMTNTPVHPREQDVLSLLNTTQADEMLPSLISRAMAPALGTLQAQPITLGASSPSEGLRYGGQALPIIPPLALKSTLTAPTGALANLALISNIRDETLDDLDAIYRGNATKEQKAYLDSLVISRSELKGINQDLLTALNNIKDNSVASQIAAAIVLFRMNVTPVVAIHIPFGGDNHNDTGLANEAKQTVAGVASIASMMQQLQDAGMQDKVSFISLNVFGRTLTKQTADGRNHNQNHQVSLSIGKPFRGGIIGGVAVQGNDYGALAIDSTSGAGMAGADIPQTETLSSFGKTVLASVGVDDATIAKQISYGKVVKGALA